MRRTKRQKRRDEIRQLKERVAVLEAQQTNNGQDKDTSKVEGKDASKDKEDEGSRQVQGKHNNTVMVKQEK